MITALKIYICVVLLLVRTELTVICCSPAQSSEINYSQQVMGLVVLQHDHSPQFNQNDQVLLIKLALLVWTVGVLGCLYQKWRWLVTRANQVSPTLQNIAAVFGTTLYLGYFFGIIQEHAASLTSGIVSSHKPFI